MKSVSKKIKIVLGIIVIITILTLQFSSYANSTDISIETLEKTQKYKEWESLSDEEKQNVVQPNIITLNIQDAIKRSTFNSLKENLAEDLPSKYNLKDYINITVKDQQSTGQCWAFSMTNILETNAAKLNSGKYTILSPRHIHYATSKTFLDGINNKGYNREVEIGGNYSLALGYITSGLGPVAETSMPFEDNDNKINLADIQGKQVVQKIEAYKRLPPIEKTYDNTGTLSGYNNGLTGNEKQDYTEEEVQAMRKVIKQQIMKYGSIGSLTYGGTDSLNYCNDSSRTAYYCNDTTKNTDHSITIVGWDDDYSVDNFKSTNKPKNNGAYIVLHSYGEEKLDHGYQYISYDDIFIESELISVEKTTDVDYDNIYQYDELGVNSVVSLSPNNITSTSTYAVNVFDKKQGTTNEKEYINEVAIQVYKTSDVEIYANLQSDDKTKIEKIATPGILESGYHTIKLSTPLEITGDKFVVGVKFTNQEGVLFPVEFNYNSNGKGSNFWDTATAEENQSFLANDINGTWLDLAKIDGFKDTNLCIKALSVYEENLKMPVQTISLDKTQLEITEGEKTNLIVTFNPTNATNKNIKWLTNDPSIVSIDTNGNITAIKEGKTLITAISEDGEKTATCEITVKAKTTDADDIYLDNVNNDNDNTNNNNTNNNINNNISNNVADNTIANKMIPYAGNSIITLSIIIIISGIAIYSFIRFIRYRDI